MRLLLGAWILITLTKPYSGRPRSRFGLWRKRIVISDVYHTPQRAYLHWYLWRALNWGSLIYLLVMNDYSFPKLVWNLANHYETTFTWRALEFYLPLLLKSYGPYIAAFLGAHWMIWRFTMKRFIVVVYGGGFVKTGRLGFPRYQFHDGDSMIVEQDVMKMQEEEEENMRRKEKAMLNGHKISPFLPHFYRDSRTISFFTSGQKREFGAIHGVKAAEAFMQRVMRAVSDMGPVDERTDWTAKKRQLRELAAIDAKFRQAGSDGSE